MDAGTAPSDGGAADVTSADASPLDAALADGAADASDLDAGPLVDAAPVDAAPVGAGEGQLCEFNPGDCAAGLVCVPAPFSDVCGLCRVDCALRNEVGDIVGEDPEACPDRRTCQIIVDPQSLLVEMVACELPQSFRDGVCQAPGDPDACADEMRCHVAYLDPDGLEPAAFRCKTTCDKDAPEGAQGCPAGELCFASSIAQDVQRDELKNPVSCEFAACTDGQPCPSECGPGDTECVTFNDPTLGPTSLCLGLFGSCEPARPGDEDAGVPAADAGIEAPDDGGVSTEDAGGAKADAGSPGGGGPGLLDEDRPAVSRPGCACEGARGGAEAPLALAFFLLVGLLPPLARGLRRARR